MVDASRVEARIQRLEELIERLDEVRHAGEDAYLTDEQQRAATERWLQVAVQICIDLGTQLVTEQSARPPSDYADVFKILGEKKVIPSDLAERLSDAAKQRNTPQADAPQPFNPMDVGFLEQFDRVIDEGVGVRR